MKTCVFHEIPIYQMKQSPLPSSPLSFSSSRPIRATTITTKYEILCLSIRFVCALKSRAASSTDNCFSFVSFFCYSFHFPPLLVSISQESQWCPTKGIIASLLLSTYSRDAFGVK